MQSGLFHPSFDRNWIVDQIEMATLRGLCMVLPASTNNKIPKGILLNWFSFSPRQCRAPGNNEIAAGISKSRFIQPHAFFTG
jgi:hypothetical protein